MNTEISNLLNGLFEKRRNSFFLKNIYVDDVEIDITSNNVPNGMFQTYGDLIYLYNDNIIVWSSFIPFCGIVYSHFTVIFSKKNNNWKYITCQKGVYNHVSDINMDEEYMVEYLTSFKKSLYEHGWSQVGGRRNFFI